MLMVPAFVRRAATAAVAELLLKILQPALNHSQSVALCRCDVRATVLEGDGSRQRLVRFLIKASNQPSDLVAVRLLR